MRPVVTPLLCAACHHAFVVRHPPSPSSFVVRRLRLRWPCARITRGPGRTDRRGLHARTRSVRADRGALHARAWTSAVARVVPSSADPTRRARPVSFTRSRSSRVEPGRDAWSSTRDTPLHVRIGSPGDFFSLRGTLLSSQEQSSAQFAVISLPLLRLQLLVLRFHHV